MNPASIVTHKNDPNHNIRPVILGLEVLRRIRTMEE